MSPDAGHLRIHELRKIYGKETVANDGISLETSPGEVFGLLGPNGAGKTTLVNQIIGLLKPTSGSIHLGGVDLIDKPATARRLCSYLPQAEPPIDSFQLQEAIELVGRIRGGDKETVRQRAESLISGLELDEWKTTLGQKLSGGVKRLAGFMMAAVWPGSLMILDEPTNDIDPLRRRLLWQEIRRIASEGTTVLLVTHNVLEAERAVDRLVVIDQAKIVAEGTPSSLKGSDRGSLRLEIMLEPDAGSPERPGFASRWTMIGRRLLVGIEDDQMPPAIDWAQSLTRDGTAEEYSLTPPTLEDTYVRLVGKTDGSEMTQEEDHVALS